MKGGTFLLMFLWLGRALAGEASGGGTPEISLVDCRDAVYVGAPIGQETTRIRAYVVAKSLTPEPVSVPSLDFEFLPDQVHFFGKDFHLYVSLEPKDEAFEGTLTLGTQSLNVSCSRLDDRFRPLPEGEASVEFRHGGEKCFGGAGQCVGYVGGLLPEKSTIPLKFDVRHGRLQGRWQAEKEIFGVAVLFELEVTQKRNQPPVHRFQIGLKEGPRPTAVTAEGASQNLEIQTPFLEVGGDRLRIWQRVKSNVEEN